MLLGCEDRKNDAGCFTSDVVIHVAFWALLFLWLRIFMFPTRSFTYSNRVVSIVHAVVSFAMCSRCLFAVDVNKDGSLKWFSDFGRDTTRCQHNTLIVSMSYFIYDTFGVLLETGVGPVAIARNLPEHLHHVATIAGLMVGVYGRTSGAELTMCLWSMELTNPFLHARTIMKEMEVDDPALTAANDAAFAVLFFLMRIVLGPVIVYHTFVNEDTNDFVKLGGLAIQLLSLFWFYKIVKIAVYKSRRRTAAASGKKEEGGAAAATAEGEGERGDAGRVRRRAGRAAAEAAEEYR